MNEVVLVFFIVYAIALGLVILIGFLLQQKKERSYQSTTNGIDLGELIVLVPFRNEEHRIHTILNSISKLKTCPKEFIFINDHSTDDSIRVIEEAKLSVPYRIMDLPNDVTGKKRALRYAISHSDSDYILTMDADVEFQTSYFENMQQLEVADMYLLPAVMKASHFLEHLYEIDLALVNAANVGVAGLKRPIMASGANLFFRRSTFDEVDNLESHKHAASGDDMYLLRDFRENNKDVRLVSGLDCAIHTETPQSFKEFINQRLRWLGKTGDLKDHLSTSMAILQSGLTLFFLVALIYCIAIANWPLLITIMAVKTTFDMILFFPYFYRIKRIITWSFIPIYEVLFPFYTIIILSLMYTYKPKWKGRTIYENS